MSSVINQDTGVLQSGTMVQVPIMEPAYHARCLTSCRELVRVHVPRRIFMMRLRSISATGSWPMGRTLSSLKCATACTWPGSLALRGCSLHVGHTSVSKELKRFANNMQNASKKSSWERPARGGAAFAIPCSGRVVAEGRVAAWLYFQEKRWDWAKPEHGEKNRLMKKYEAHTHLCNPAFESG